MIQDLPKVIRKVSELLEKPLSKDGISLLAEHLKFDNMKNNLSVNLEPHLKFLNDNKICESKNEIFMRKGKTGSYKEEISQQMEEAFDKWTQENLQGTDFPFYK